MDAMQRSNVRAAFEVAIMIEMRGASDTRDAGIDVVSVGGTKNGALGAEAIVVLNPAASAGLLYGRKFNMQLASKMRFLSAQLIALYEGDLWLRNAQHANAMAARPQ